MRRFLIAMYNCRDYILFTISVSGEFVTFLEKCTFLFGGQTLEKCLVRSKKYLTHQNGVFAYCFLTFVTALNTCLDCLIIDKLTFLLFFFLFANGE